MEGKLIKVENGYVLMVDNTMYATDNDKLSLKNCEAIANGYNLSELACDEIGIDISVIKHIDRKSEAEKSSPCTALNEGGCLGAALYHMAKGFEIGFQKALELLGDRKFSESDVVSMIEKSRETGLTAEYLILTKQQTEWDVEVETYIFSTMDDKSGFSERRPKLDDEGCLILKRIEK